MYTEKFTRTKYEFNTLAPYTVDSLPLEGDKGWMLSGVFVYLCYYGSVHCVSCWALTKHTRSDFAWLYSRADMF